MNAPGIGPYGGEDKNTVLGRGGAFAPLRPHPALWKSGGTSRAVSSGGESPPLPVPRAAWAPPGEERDAGPEALAAQERCPQGAGRRARRRPRPQRGRASPSAPKGVCAPRPAPRSPTQCSLWFSRKRAGSVRAQDSTTMKPTESQIQSSSPRTLGEGRPLVGLRRDRPPRWPEARGLHLAGTCLCEPGLCLRRGAA